MRSGETVAHGGLLHSPGQDEAVKARLGRERRGHNIVFFLCDSMDGRAMGCMGHPAAHTPNMDRLAQRGTLFRNTYSNFPQCCPARASLWSGKQVHEIDAWNNYVGLDEDDTTWQSDLRAGGYLSGSFGKTDYVSGKHSLGTRVNSWIRAANITLPQKGVPRAILVEPDTAETRAGDWRNVEASIEWLKMNATRGHQPFALFCGANIPHPPYRTSRRYLDLIDPGKVTVPPFEDNLHPCIEYMSRVKNSFGDIAHDDILAIRRTYLAMIAELDAMLGRLLQAVDNLGLADSTYFVFSSDHGDMQMEHRLWLKNALYEASARVPLIVAGPGVRPGAVVEEPVSLIDLYPTFLDMAALPGRSGLAGCSLLPELKGIPRQNADLPERPDRVLSQYHSSMLNTGGFMLRRGEWKYVAYEGYEPQLFNLADDPEEMNNLAPSMPDKAREMDEQLLAECDYHAVDARAKDYDRRSFVEWRDTLDADAYRIAMGEIMGTQWTDELEGQIRVWLGE